MFHYKLYNLLHENKLLSKYSVADYIIHLKYIFKIKTDSQWLTSEASAKTSKLLDYLGLDMVDCQAKYIT